MKNYWITKLHTLLGITAGIVLCVVGVTGAIQSFEEDLLRLLNTGVFEPEPGATLPFKELLEHAQSSRPDKRIASWQIYSAPGHPMRIGFAAAAAEQSDGQNGNLREQGDNTTSPAKTSKPRTEYQYQNTATGVLYPPLPGEGFFRTVNDIHRRLAAGDIGKRIVGASVLALVVLCLSGLYLRWPHNPFNWRNWFKLDFKLKGRRFLRDLHMKTATWLLLLYLLSALTGLSWSYDWYKNGLYALTGTATPARELKLERPARATADIEKLWQAFQRESGGRFSEATFRFPEKAEHALEIRYLDVNSSHNRAYSRLFLNPDDATVVARERYTEKSAGEKLMASMYPLHTGNFFGLAGILLLMISSLLMPLFGITGWKMYLDRHRREHKAAGARDFARGGDTSES